ncbi:MAG: NUDIX domain-containing protein [Ignavibacteriaceae bacterium]|nr:MAG: NUDIX domain-containing protein [Chlorobiota bacterium]KXK05881.1 MAG: hydrolase, NUDIX family protein [Chlorobi bacterium OLB4]MBV6398291.1 hypothetical protein [Ignavibacteria bacterium]MCC6886117.1 NUDIX domain-containing protein [Ignavibacteriales bacterium]MCE7952631.1 NUDIX domain-containing protein [Chlorobi bacterium CHB7]MDL1886743.1 NUDIX domain-containing protein [Ignavibacteria bacterium CHB1]MEB2329589.1 NUDIX domain-containing protein [Ignavibacteriaceae bacterium]OQY77
MSGIVSNFVEVFLFRYFEGKPKYLLLKRSEKVSTPNIWQVLTATINTGETAFQTAIREIGEETGLKVINLYSAPFVSSFYRQDTDSVHIAPIFIAEVSDGSVVISDEHTECKWCNLDEAINLLYWFNQIENLKLTDIHLKEEKYFKTLTETKKIKL